MTNSQQATTDMFNNEAARVAVLAKQVSNLVSPTIKWGGFNRRKTSLGVCKFNHNMNRYTIQLSENITRLPESTIMNTIRHELAHAYAGINNGHNRVWKSWAKLFGCNGERCANTTEVKGFVTADDYKYYVVNTLTMEVIRGYHRMPKKDFSRSSIIGKPETLGKLKLIPVWQFKQMLEKSIHNSVKELRESGKIKS